MRLELDWVVGVIRVGDETQFKGAEPGTSYSFVCSVIRKNDEVYIYGAHGKLNREVFRAIREKMIELGIERVTYERLNTERLRKRVVEIGV